MSKIVSASSEKRQNNASILRDRRFVINENSAFAITEEYKTLRTNIMFSIPKNGCKVIGISSAESMEGKSINCLNTAITFAQTGARVLLVDCDLRVPRLGSLIAIDSIPGISNILVGMNTIEESIHKTQFSGLDVLLSGDIPPNPSELLGSDSMGKLIEELSQNYDYIFVDLPPINVVADTSIMSKYLSGIVFVVRASVSKRDTTLKAINKLEIANANIIGVILNGVKSKSSHAKKDRDYGSYRKYGYAEANRK